MTVAAIDRLVHHSTIFELNVESYHAVNLIIHLLVGLLLYAIVLKTIRNVPLATAVAAIWIVHPLNTEAVTYVVQRSESLAALFYLAVIYCLIRAAEGRAAMWSTIAVLCCALARMSCSASDDRRQSDFTSESRPCNTPVPN